MDKIITISGKKVALTNLEKTFWPAKSGIDGKSIAKGDLITYYQKIAPTLLPYIKDRPITMRRFPNGVDGQMFYQQHAPEKRPAWIETRKIIAKSSAEKIEHLIINNEASLIYIINLGCIDIYPWFSSWQEPDYPKEMVFDLDARFPVDFSQVIKVALIVKEMLEQKKIISFPKTSGSTGLHILVPLSGKNNYEQVRNFAKNIAVEVQEQLPDLVTTTSQNKDMGKILIDYSQNSRGKTLAAPYSVRPVPGALVSAPVTWLEVERGVKLTDFNIKNIFSRIKKTNEIYQKLLENPRFLLK